MPDTLQTTEILLADVERQLDAVDAGLMASEPTELEAACAGLRRTSIDFAAVLGAALSAEAFEPSFRRRIETVAQRLGNQRDSLARRNVVVERALASIMRRHTDATYSVPGGRSTFGATAATH